VRGFASPDFAWIESSQLAKFGHRSMLS
jgi:hypothetical protein